MASRIPIPSIGGAIFRRNPTEIPAEPAVAPEIPEALEGNADLVDPQVPEIGGQNGIIEEQNPAVEDVLDVVENVEPAPAPANINAIAQIQVPEEGPQTEREINIKRLENLMNFEISFYRNTDRKKFERNLVVSPYVFLSKYSKNSTEFSGVITLKNTSEVNMTYWIRSSPKFSIGSPAFGLISPKAKAVIPVQSCRFFVRSFADTQGESFTVLATPVFNKDLLDITKLMKYWKVYGSDFFPATMAESHFIDRLIPNENSENFSMMDLMAQFPKCRSKYEFELLNTSEMYRAWEISGNKWNTNYVLDKQYEEYLKNEKLRQSSVGQKDFFLCIITFCFIVWAGWYVHDWIQECYEEIAPVPLTWYEGLWEWIQEA